MRETTRFEAMKAITNERKFSELVFDIIVKCDSPITFAKFLSEELTKGQLRTIRSVAERGDYPLSLDGKQ